MPTPWVDFKAVRTQVRFGEVLKRYGVDFRSTPSGQTSAHCPLPGHPPPEGRHKPSRSFSAHLERGLFQCFKCRASGNVLDFVTLMEGGDPSRAADVRMAAVKLCEWFGLHANLRSKRAKLDLLGQPRLDLPTTPVMERRTPVTTTAAAVLVNQPLDFELKDLDPTHDYLGRRGFTVETLTHFGVGYCRRGMLKERVAIPLHDSDGRLVGYAGRVVDDASVSAAHPRYLLPGARERHGVRLEFRKSLLLYNAHRVAKPVDDLVVVEGFTHAWWLHQHGIGAVVALMGSDCSAAQATGITELVSPDGRIWLMPDGDAAGAGCAQSCFRALGPLRWVRWVQLPEGQQPTDLVMEELAALLPLAETENGTPSVPHAAAPGRTKQR